MESTTFERYPWSIILLSNALAFSIYGIGVYALSGLGWWFVVGYAVYCLWLEFGVLKKSCVNCCYYGNWCGLGKGKLCALLFRRGDPEAFAAAEASWRDVAPSFLVGIFPLIGGIVVLSTRGWSWLLAALLVALILLSSAGNAIVRGSCLCKHCKQRELGCPAEKLFGGAQR